MAEEDILYGKHRHLFGGVEPSNMLIFDVTWDNDISAVRIKAELPKDTVIEEQTVCSVLGAVIRRKINGYPKDEFDGELVKTLYESGSFIDESANDINTTYYYAAFPFTSQGVYNRNEENLAVVNDIPNLTMTSEHFVISGINNTGLYTRLFFWPFIIGTNGNNQLSKNGWTGYIVRKSLDKYPMTENDGIEVYSEDTIIGSFENIYDYDVSEGVTYYYAIFPFRVTDDGTKVYSYNIKNRYKITANPYSYLFGYDLDTTDPNPNTRVTYPDDVDNSVFTPAKMDYSGGTFNYGDWECIIPTHSFRNLIGFMPIPVRIDSSGKQIGSVLSDNDYTVNVDGKDVSTTLTDTTTDYNVMMEWSKIYTKRELTADGIYKFRCSNYKIDDTWECWCNYDKDGNEVDNFYTAVYPACETTGPKLRSLSGQSMETGSYVQYWIDYADNNGDGWHIESIADRLLIQDLLVLMAKTTDCQKAYGKGVCAGKDAVTNTGTMDKRGLFWGSEDPSEGVKVFGMEHWWGNKYRRVAGLISVDGNYKLKITRSTKDGSTATDFNLDGTNYIDLGYGFDCAVSQSSEYISDMEVIDHGRLPIEGKGTSTRCEADTATIAKSGTMYAKCGGASLLKECYVGPFALDLTDSGMSTSNDICVAISYKG